MPDSEGDYHRALHWFAIGYVAAIFVLLGVGGTVTSYGAGMAVPDWPNTFGYNMFLAPLHVWATHFSTFLEHFHRLFASFVGVLTIILTIWLIRTEKGRTWLQWAGVVLLVMVIVQGLMGGFRVTERSEFLAGVHGVFGQLTFAAAVLIASATSRTWLRHQRGTRAQAAGMVSEGRTGGATGATASEAGDASKKQPTRNAAFEERPETRPGYGLPRGPRWLAIGLLVVIFVQLILGSAVRHDHAGLAIPDLPTVYGHWMPPATPVQLHEDIARWNQAPPNGRTINYPYTLSQVHLHFTHRVFALVVVAVAMWLVLWLNVKWGGLPETRWPARWIVLMLAAQVLLGASIVWSGRNPEIATAHQLLGAATLGVAVWLAIRVHLVRPMPEAAELTRHADAVTGYDGPTSTSPAPVTAATAVSASPRGSASE